MTAETGRPPMSAAEEAGAETCPFAALPVDEARRLRAVELVFQYRATGAGNVKELVGAADVIARYLRDGMVTGEAA